jgi:transcriptional regulator with XRE-family HTH domain
MATASLMPDRPAPRPPQVGDTEFEIAAALIRARMRAGLTQTQLAARMNTSQSTIARLESGRATPSWRTLKRFAEVTQTRLMFEFEPLKPK